MVFLAGMMNNALSASGFRGVSVMLHTSIDCPCSVQVAALSKWGTGEKSHPVSVRTLSSSPTGPPENITITTLNAEASGATRLT